jgi:hypothetical protein
MAGRKSQMQELQIKERYSALAEPYFKFLQKTLDKGSDKDKKWAVEQLTKAYSRMIPLQGDFEGNFTVTWKDKL